MFDLLVFARKSRSAKAALGPERELTGHNPFLSKR
jgi:hypothetical protein